MDSDLFSRVRQDAAAKEVKFIDLKLLDLTGRLHHVSLPLERFLPEIMEEGIGFDGSSYGFLKVENSDMVVIPDLRTAHLDPFRDQPTLSMLAEVRLADAQRTRYPQDGRAIAAAAEAALRSLGIAERSLWAPEYEFYVFESAEYQSDIHDSRFLMRGPERFFQNAYHACNPHDEYDDFRDEACAVMRDFGMNVRYHHHEGGAMGQQEIEAWFADLPATADHAVLTKYILFNLARRRGLRVTFMPKPLYDNAGSGLHLHQFLVQGGHNVFNDPGGFSGLSEIALHYIGGILRHSPALCALTNPSTNSYKRLVPGFEAPTTRTFGSSNRGASIRIPSYVADPEYRRIEYRPTDFTSNPYLCMAAILMAGIDGILERIDPAQEGHWPEESSASDRPAFDQFLPRSLDDALDALAKDHGFLMRAGVFPEALIQHWLEIKWREIHAINRRPHPYEFTMYFDL